jgi:hypothetical protein
MLVDFFEVYKDFGYRKEIVENSFDLSTDPTLVVVSYCDSTVQDVAGLIPALPTGFMRCVYPDDRVNRLYQRVMLYAHFAIRHPGRINPSESYKNYYILYLRIRLHCLKHLFVPEE